MMLRIYSNLNFSLAPHLKRSRVHHVHAMLSTNTIEGNGNLDDGITTKVSITHQAIPKRSLKSGYRVPESQSPPFADASDTDDNSEEDEVKMDENMPNINRTNYCSSKFEKRYCSLQCYKAGESNIR